MTTQRDMHRSKLYRQQIALKAGLERMKVISSDIVEGSLVVERHDVVATKLPD